MKRITRPLLVLVLVVAVSLLGCRRTGQGIKIGAILALTGDAAKYGQACRRGIDLAVEQTNSTGGIGGRKLSIVYEDTQADPKIGVSALRKLITVDKVQVVIGAGASSVTLAAAPIAEENDVVLLSPVSSAPAVTQAGDYIFRNVMSDLYEGSGMAQFARKELKIARAAILYINNDFGVGLRDSFKRRFEQLAGEITSVESFEQGASDFRTQLIKIKNSQPEAIYLVGYKEMGRVLRQAGEMAIGIRFLSFAMFEDPEILKMAGNAAEGVYYSSRAYDPQSREDVVSDFVKKYRSRFNAEPDIFAALSYDAARIVFLAIKKGGPTGREIKKALYTIKDFPGVTGTTSFDQNGDVIKSVSIKMVKNGQFAWHTRKYQ